jgi:hypothetical protein
MHNPDFSKVATLILKQVLSYHYVPFLRLGGYSGHIYVEIERKIQIDPG